eukprot:30936-Pelagococcus_subviridis.AAC.32
MTLNNPSSLMPWVKTNRPAKNKSESHSTFSSACSKSSLGDMTRIAIAPNSAAYAGSKCNTGCRKNKTNTKHKMIPHLARPTWSRMGYRRTSSSTSTSIFLE